MAVVVTAASADDGAAAPKPLGHLNREAFPRPRLVWADQKYHNHSLLGWVAANARFRVEVVRRPDGAKGFVLLPKGWVVERTFAWLGRYRRHCKDHEVLTRSSEAMVEVSGVHMLLKRLAPKEPRASFAFKPHHHKRKAA